MSGVMESVRKKSVLAYARSCSDLETALKSSGRAASVLAEIRSDWYPNMCPETYLYSKAHFSLEGSVNNFGRMAQSVQNRFKGGLV
jgi:hypothetical protein